jgi:hypothetical protein
MVKRLSKKRRFLRLLSTKEPLTARNIFSMENLMSIPTRSQEMW